MGTPTLINAQQAIRLYKLAREPAKSANPDQNINFPSPDDDNVTPSAGPLPTCRICRLDSNSDLMVTPCDCKGTMGHIHRKCMKIWHYKRRSKMCEICNRVQIDDTILDHSIWTKLSRLFKNRAYLWRIARDLFNFSSVTIMVFCNLSQSLDLFDHLVDQNNVSFPAKSLIVQGVTLYSGYFLHLYFIWATRTFEHIRSDIFRVKWVLNEEQLPPPIDDDSSIDSFGFEHLFQFP